MLLHVDVEQREPELAQQVAQLGTPFAVSTFVRHLLIAGRALARTASSAIESSRPQRSLTFARLTDEDAVGGTTADADEAAAPAPLAAARSGAFAQTQPAQRPRQATSTRQPPKSLQRELVAA